MSGGDLPLLASGRSADVYDLGDGRVLRRSRRWPIADHEVTAMRLAHRHGFPVPAVHRVEGTEMELDRVDGPDWFAQLTRRPWTARRVGRDLGRLHRDLDGVPLDGVELRVVIEPGDALFHGDLHPGNVLAAASGPVVIDWESAGRAPHGADAAVTWLLLTVAEADDLPRPVRPFERLVRRLLLAGFFSIADRPGPEVVAAVCDLRLADTNLRPVELERIRRFRTRHG